MTSYLVRNYCSRCKLHPEMMRSLNYSTTCQHFWLVQRMSLFQGLCLLYMNTNKHSNHFKIQSSGAAQSTACRFDEDSVRNDQNDALYNVVPGIPPVIIQGPYVNCRLEAEASITQTYAHTKPALTPISDTTFRLHGRWCRELDLLFYVIEITARVWHIHVLVYYIGLASLSSYQITTLAQLSLWRNQTVASLTADQKV
jgi:hypothetical protein